MQVVQAYSSFSDSELADIFAEGDDKAFTEIYNRYFGILYVHAFKILGNEDEAKDILQELFSSLWVRRQDLRLTGNLSSYLYAAVRNKMFDLLAHKKVASKYTDSLRRLAGTSYLITDHRIRERELKILIEKEIAALPAKMRHIFELSRKEYYSHQEIAHKLNLSEQTVRTQVKNALRILRVKLGTFLFSILLLIN